MAVITSNTDAASRLAALARVKIIMHPHASDPQDIALIFAGVCCLEIRETGAGHMARFHVGLGEYLLLAEAVPLATAFAAVCAFVSLVASVPVEYAPAHDAAERAAAAEVFAAFTAPLSMPLAA